MTIEEIFHSENINVRTLNICKDNDLNHLSEILDFYHTNNSFGKLRNCGQKSNDELIALCNKFNDYDNLNIVQSLRNDKQIVSKIEDLFYSEDISVRTLNICIDNDLNDIYKIIEFYYKNSSFDKLRNCGKKSNGELIALCKKYRDYYNLKLGDTLIPKKQIVITISNLTRVQKDVINSFIEINANNLSIRSINSLNSFLNGNFKIRNIYEKILIKKNFNFYQIKNVGKKTATELRFFFDSLMEFIEKVLEVENENDLISLRNSYFIEKTFSISSIPIEIIESQSIFKIVEFLIIKDVIFEKKENVIFQKSLKIFYNQSNFTLDEIANLLSLTRERVRQIKKIILENLFKRLRFLKTVDEDLYKKYGIDKNQNIINIDYELNNRINEVNSTNFSIEFNAILIYVYLSDEFELIGELEDILHINKIKSKDRHNWNYFYLVRNQLIIEFDFNNFVDDVNKRINAKIEESYSFYFISYLMNFAKDKDFHFFIKLLPIAEKIINQEFNLILDINDNIEFKRNTIKHVSEYFIEALEKLGVPSKIDDIFKLIENDYPGVTKNHESLRGSLQRSSEIIIFGRSSTYGLKKWEIEKEGIKGGTIKNIISEYLQDKVEPIHILEILNEVHKYRANTSAKNIISNLNLDSSKKFVVFSQSFIGLSGKSYKSNLAFLPKFLGKTITTYIKNQKNADRISIEEYFAYQLNISSKNIKFIIDYLIVQQYVLVDKLNRLTI